LHALLAEGVGPRGVLGTSMLLEIAQSWLFINAEAEQLSKRAARSTELAPRRALGPQPNARANSASVESSLAPLVVNAARYRASVLGWTGNEDEEVVLEQHGDDRPRAELDANGDGTPPNRARSLLPQSWRAAGV
jgi:hypothetical protein